MKLIDLDHASPELRIQAWELYECSFPSYERWGKEAFSRASEDSRFHTKLAIDDRGRLIALLYYWTFSGMLYVEFLAVNTSMRGQNIGTLLVQELIDQNPGLKVFLEIDPPIDDISIRRLHFYERLGFLANQHEHIHPSYISGEGAYPHRLIIMTHGELMTEAEFAEFRDFLISALRVYGD